MWIVNKEEMADGQIAYVIENTNVFSGSIFFNRHNFFWAAKRQCDRLNKEAEKYQVVSRERVYP